MAIGIVLILLLLTSKADGANDAYLLSRDTCYAVSPIYGGKTIDVCTDMDLVCRGTIDANDPGASWSAHLQPAYIDSGAVDGAADFVAARL